MAKLQQNYESIIVFSTKQTEEQIKALVEKFSDMITRDGGTLESIDEWGKRRLAYPINYETDGYYVLYNFISAPNLPAELDRVIKITEGVIRSIIIAKNN